MQVGKVGPAPAALLHGFLFCTSLWYQSIMRRSACRTVSLLMCGAFALINAVSSQAQVKRVADYHNPVRAGAKTTYLDLLKEIFPDVEMDSAAGHDATAHTSIKLNHLLGDYRGQPYRGEMKINSIESPGDHRRHQSRMLLLIHVGSDDGELFNWGEMSVLALFQLEPVVKLLDAADVQADRFTSFWEERPLLTISPQEDAVIIANTHHNSSQGYLRLALVAPENNRLRTIFELPTLLNTNVCGNSFSQSPSISALRSAKGARYNISINIKLVKEADDESCEQRTRGFTKYYKALLVWNSSKRLYESRGAALDRLSRFNEKNY